MRIVGLKGLKISRRCTKLCVVVDIVDNFGRVECNLLNSHTRNMYESHSATETFIRDYGVVALYIDFYSVAPFSQRCNTNTKTHLSRHVLDNKK